MSLTEEEQKSFSRREKWFESFLEKEKNWGLWNYTDEEGFPLWSFLRNTVAFRLSSKENAYHDSVHAKTKKYDHLLRYPHEHFRVLYDVFFKKGPSYDAFFQIPAHYLIADDNQTTTEMIDRITGGFYDFFEEPLVFEQAHQGRFFRQIKNLRHDNVHLYSTISLFAKATELLNHFSASKAPQKRTYELAQKVESLSEGLLSKTETINNLNRMHRKKGFFDFFAKKLSNLISGKKAFIHCCSYLGIGAYFVFALHRYGFTVIEPQHGYIGPNHRAYNYPKEIFNLPGVQKVFPDYFLTFGEKWGQDISIPSKVLPVGHKYLEDYVKTNQPKKDDGSNILVVSKGTVTEQMVEIAKTVATAFPEKKIIYKLHPGEIPFKERYQELEGFTNIEIIGFENILPLIAKAKYIVGYNSTTLFEALAFPGKVIFCPPNSYTCGQKGFNFFETSEQLVQMIRKEQGNISDGVAEEYWSPNWASNVKKLPFLTTKEPQ
jgi:hypothetical protein